MSRFHLTRIYAAIAALALLAPTASRLAAAPEILELRTQLVGDRTYFRVRFEPPADMQAVKVEAGPLTEKQRWNLARLPQLVPQDTNSRAVYQRLVLPNFRPSVQFDADSQAPLPVRGLEFVGQVSGHGKAKFLLLYPQRNQAADSPPKEGLAALLDQYKSIWVEVPVELDFAKATVIAAPRKRNPGQAPARDDLEGLWAEGQVARFAVLEALAPQFGFYSFACGATGRKYGVQAPYLGGPEATNREHIHRQLYETTTGAAAITESLQLHRMLASEFRDRGQRSIDIWKVPGIDIAEHPWRKMMGDKKPAAEPLARFVPHDNYYVHFKNIRKLIELGELLDQWGTNALRAYEMNSRDVNLKQRYERQLCIRSGWLGKTFGPAVVRSVAITGSDAYLREGSDVTVIFHVVNKQVFLTAVEQFIQEARKEFAGQLKETKADYHGVPIEIFTTPLREVSLHRAVLGDFVIYSNSPTALRRALDAHHGRLKCLADSLDFQYMRTAFRLDDPEEDGFAFLSDAFIRQLVGPASKIKEKRRLEALTSLSMVTNAVMFTAWETGRVPGNHVELLASSALKQELIYTPEGKGVVWDGERRAAVSDAYNTMHFATPLIELPIDKITPTEQQEYGRFRQDYLKLWRQYFDPVGFRVALNHRQVKMETYILPLIRLSEYDFLNQIARGGTGKLDPTSFPVTTVLQGAIHLSPSIRGLVETHVFKDKAKSGDLFLVRVDDIDDCPAFRKLAELRIRQDLEPEKWGELQNEMFGLLEQFPVTAGIRVHDARAFAKALPEIEASIQFGTTQRKSHNYNKYKGIPITWTKVSESLWVYHALVEDIWYIGFSENALKVIIDQFAARRENKESGKKQEMVEINGSIYFAPAAMKKAGEALRYLLEWESHRRAVGNGPIWYSLYRSGLVSEKDSARVKQAQAMRYLGFVPVSPDGAAYVYDGKTDSVLNQRHGSLGRPQLHDGIEKSSPLGQLLEQFRTIRADLRFREDGVHTTLTLERKPVGK